MKRKLLANKSPKNSQEKHKKQGKLFGHLSTVKNAAKAAAESKAGGMAIDAALSSVPIVPSSVKEKVLNEALDAAGADIEIGGESNSDNSAINQNIQAQQANIEKVQNDTKVIKSSLIKLIKRVNQLEERFKNK